MRTTQALRIKLRGYEGKLGRMVAEMADAETGPQVRGWIEVKLANPHDQLDKLAGLNWIAYLHVRTPDEHVYSCPCIPDEFIDRAVRSDDKPHVFRHMAEAESFANKELPGFVQHIKEQL